MVADVTSMAAAQVKRTVGEGPGTTVIFVDSSGSISSNSGPSFYRCQDHRRLIDSRLLSAVVLPVLFLSLVVSPSVTASGQFQMRLISYRNIRGQLADGSCCRSSISGQDEGSLSSRQTPSSSNGLSCVTDNAVGGPCNVVFRACLREHQVRAAAADGLMCTFGNATTSKPRRGNSLTFVDSDNGSSISLSFDFAWTVSI